MPRVKIRLFNIIYLLINASLLIITCKNSIFSILKKGKDEEDSDNYFY
jgi:hypothetical protein